MKNWWTRFLFGMLVGMLLLPLTAGAEERKTFSREELDQILAPIALYPDALLAQIFMASTYPLEVVEAARWTKANPKMSPSALEDAMQGKSWDPSVKSLTAVPQVLAMMNEKLEWTQKLGDAFLAQQSEVMDTAQELRAKAQQQGNLKSGQEQRVVTEPSDGKTIIKIESVDPQVIYVPTYNPSVVYGAWWYPAYPPYYYYPPGYVAGGNLISFGLGVAVGAAIWGNCNWGWGRGDVNVNVNRYNQFNRTNIQNNNWQHNTANRRGVAYRDQATAQRYNRSGSSANIQSREAFRGHAEQGRAQMRGSDVAERVNRGEFSGAQTMGASGHARQQVSGSSRDFSGARASAFEGAGNGAATRDFSNRGHASMGNTARSRSGGGQGFSGGGRAGGARAGGGRAGGRR